jgi:tetratricopeptide (TPR) repeat protein
MKCPNCGAEIPEGHLYCEVCGEEINFVPEFDPLIENRINESLSGVADDLKDESVFYTKRLPGSKANKNELKPFVIPAITAVGIIIAFIIVLMFMFDGQKSPGNYEEQAEKYYVEGKLDQAITAIDSALSTLPAEETEKRAELVFMKYEYQMEAGEKDAAINTIHELSDSSIYGDDTALAAMDQIIASYEQAGAYADIHELLINSDLTVAKEKYLKYLPEAPKIYPEEGTYEEPVNVRITDSTDGNIYYTVNGAEPDETSILYENELVLEEEGNYVIKTAIVNRYGIKSDVSTAAFHLENFGPAEPSVMEESGEYTSATMIVAVCDPGCRIFYTTDGSTPTESSTEYTAPISMPVGTTTFKFVTVDDEGNYSEVVEKNYHLSYTTMVSVDQARESIIKILYKLDILLDMSGLVRGEEGHYDYVYSGDIEIAGSGDYYMFTETHVFNDGHTSDTGLLYAVNKHDGKVNRLGYDSSGNYTLITISNR